MKKLTHQTLLNKLGSINVVVDDKMTLAEEKSINKLQPAVERAQKLKNEYEELTEKYTNSVMELKALVETICESKRLCKIVHTKLTDRTGFNN
jgi:DNA repair exonuclease SbcCD ATPase subunit